MYIPTLKKSYKVKTIKRIIIGLLVALLFLTFASFFCRTENKAETNH